MHTLLKIQSSLFGSQGQSSQLADRLTTAWLAQHPQGRVITRELTADAVPHLTAEGFQSFSLNAEARSPQQQAVVDYSDALIDELRTADTLVLAVPMYNFSVPSTLRAYFDHIARAGVTFRYSSAGPEGLITGKKAYVIVTRGGILPPQADTQTPYLRQFLGFIGITDVEFVYAEGLAYGEDAREKSIAAAREQIAQLIEPQAMAA